jgi:hypothetical protein
MNQTLTDINTALSHNDPRWILRFITKAQLDAMDDELVKRHHPLAFEAGTQEHRFMALARQGWQF